MSSGFLGTPAIEEDVEFTRGTITSDHRDFERPRQSYYANTYPQSMGANNIDDLNYLLEGVWKDIKEKAHEVAEEVSSWISEEKEPEKKIPEKDEELEEIEELEKPKIPKKQEQKEIDKSSLISSFQSYLKASHPIIGSPYTGPVDGNINQQLILAAKQVENMLAAAVNKMDDLNRGDRIKGKIYNPTADTFNTSTQDIDNAINAIVKYQSKSKTSYDLSRKELLLAISRKIVY